MRRFAIASCCFLGLLVPSSAEELPVVEISLVPPARPFPEVANVLSDMEQSREVLEAAQMESVRRAFVDALAGAKVEIGNVIGRAMRAFDDARVGGSAMSRWHRTLSLL